MPLILETLRYLGHPCHSFLVPFVVVLCFQWSIGTYQMPVYHFFSKSSFTKCKTLNTDQFISLYSLLTHRGPVMLYPDSKIHGADMGPTWVLPAPDGPHVDPTNLAIRVWLHRKWSTLTPVMAVLAFCLIEGITRNNVGLSLSCGIQLRSISQQMHKLSFPTTGLKIMLLTSQLHLPGVNEFTVFVISAYW